MTVDRAKARPLLTVTGLRCLVAFWFLMKEEWIVELDPMINLTLTGLNYAFFGGAMAFVGYTVR